MKKKKFISILVALAVGNIPYAQAQQEVAPSASASPLTGAPAAAGEQNLPKPAEATLANVVKAMVRAGVLNLSDDRVIDDFARAVDCDIYTHYYTNEFDWRKVRTAIRQSIQQQISTYPTRFYLYRDEHFAQYDFATQRLVLAPSSVMKRTVYLLLAQAGDAVCGNSKLDTIPSKVIAALQNPIQIDGIPLSEDQANLIVKTMDDNNNGRLVYGRYTISLLNGFKIAPDKQQHSIDITAALDKIEFFLPNDFTKPFWSGQNSLAEKLMNNGGLDLDKIPFKGVNVP